MKQRYNTICQGDSTTLTVTNPCLGCGYNWSNALIGQSADITTAGNFYVIASNACGASAHSNTVHVTMNAAPAQPVITATGATLTSSATTGNQWYLNGTSLAGATAQTFHALQTGTYTVKVTGTNGCSATSLPYQLMTTGIQEYSIASNVLIIPNPNNGVFTIQSMDEGVYSIMNELGQTIQEIKLNKTNNYTVPTFGYFYRKNI